VGVSVGGGCTAETVMSASTAPASSARPIAMANAKRRPSGGGFSQRDLVESDIWRLVARNG
jgi:hypothetical protein